MVLSHLKISFGDEIDELRFKAELAALQDTSGYSALHTVGLLDDVNPPEGAREVAAALGGEICSFKGGHEVPLDEAAVEAFGRFLTDVSLD